MKRKRKIPENAGYYPGLLPIFPLVLHKWAGFFESKRREALKSFPSFETKKIVYLCG